MAKVQFSDVVPPDKRSIRNVPIPNGGKRKMPIVVKPEKDYATKNFSVPEENTSTMSAKISEIENIKNNKAYEYYYPKNKEEPEPYTNTYKKPNKKRFIFGGVIVVVVAVFLVAMMTVFASATVSITPKSQEVAVSMDLTATVEATPDSVRYEIIKLSKSQTASVPATGEESVELEAHGKIVIYNNFSSEPQKLIVRTRFESPEGLIYRIPESVMVPGKSVKNGVETPGSVEVEVFADEAGEKYNIKKTDFTIPGFKNDAPRYKNFYARSSTDMVGGFVGKMKTVSPSEKQAALQRIDMEAQALLEKDLKSKVPEGLALLPNSVIYESRELLQTEESDSIILGKEITAYAIMLNSRDLSGKIIAKYIETYSDWQNIRAFIRDFSSLEVTKKLEKIEAGQKLDLQITGKAKFFAEIDTDLVSQKLAGVGRKEVVKLMDEFIGISNITVVIRPIWKQSFPENPLKINVKTDTSK